MDFESIERRLADITCPVCKNSTEYMIPRDSRVTDGEYKAFCKGCRYSFPLHMDVESFTRSQPDVAYWLKGMRCPSCMKTGATRSEEHTSELQSRLHLVCRLLLEKKKLSLRTTQRVSPYPLLNQPLVAL